MWESVVYFLDEKKKELEAKKALNFSFGRAGDKSHDFMTSVSLPLHLGEMLALNSTKSFSVEMLIQFSSPCQEEEEEEEREIFSEGDVFRLART